MRIANGACRGAVFAIPVVPPALGSSRSDGCGPKRLSGCARGPLGDGVSMEAVGQIAPFWLEFSHNKYKYV